jgi:hypothetical protein
MRESDVLRMFLARADNYEVASVKHTRGRAYSVVMGGTHYNAVVLSNSFAFYEKRYHICLQKPTLVVCFAHDTVLPVPVLSMRAGNLAKQYELPEEIKDIEEQRRTKIGTRVLLGMYISGVRLGQTIFKDLPDSTRYRYLQKIEQMGKRKRGRPVDTQKQQMKEKP